MERLVGQALRVLFGVFWIAASQLNAATPEKDLDGIKKKIEREKRGISQIQKKEGSILQSMGRIEEELERKAKGLATANSKLESIVAEMRKKQVEEDKIISSLRRRQELFEKRAVALYRWFKGGSPFILFNGDASLSAFLQRKHYLETTILFDRNLVQKLSEEAQHQSLLRAELARKREELNAQKETLAEARQNFRHEAEKKRQLLASVRKEKESRVRALKELEQAALRLQKMMEEISRRSASKPREPATGPGLDSVKGRFDWPVKGELTGVFGKTRHPEFSAEVFRKGIDIEAPMGEQIKAVERGKVVFADRFAGYGKMIIIDHGDRFYTIYAHLSEILKKNGDGVSRGETVGLVGDSDSLAGAKLYFEMRKDGRSIDPLPWFRKQ